MIARDKQAEFVKEIRDKSRLSQRKFAEVFNKSGAYIAQVESGSVALSEDVYNLIIQHYGYLANDKVNNDYITIDYYPDVFGSCGSGAFVVSEIKEVVQVPRRLFEYFSPTYKYSIINAIGDSMQPYIIDNDRLIVQHCDQGEQIKDNRIYIFCVGNEIFIKRLSKNIDQVIIKSDNPDYKIRYIEKEDLSNLFIIGEIVGIVRNLR